MTLTGTLGLIANDLSRRISEPDLHDWQQIKTALAQAFEAGRDGEFTITVADLGDGRYACHAEVFKSLDTLYATVRANWPQRTIKIRLANDGEKAHWRTA